MKARLFTIPASHPSWAARLMLERKGIAYKRVDLVEGIHRLVLRAARFPGVTVPALILDGRRIQGTGTIARELDRLVPEPPLLPADPAERTRVEEAERWGDEVLQPIPRRMVWNLLQRDRSPIRSYLEGSRTGLPVPLAAATAGPVIALGAKLNAADDDAVRADLAALPDAVDHIDELIAEGVIGGEVPNVADFQIATSTALLLTMADVRPLFAGRPAEELARRLVPAYPGDAPPVLPTAWLEPLRAARAT
ncbi:MAG: glutathione S-transferase N-terminal domain-containing protein [Solirubrobacterales bacterium]|nr:glutathione S-transferase N-terminal domain-containing protein [Solirubrobacterales bacterium]MCB8970717.1 glutathione S-transferase N-terminal domain-containing protein [Thermoleophilales bacterium]MCO5328318.1 glutathione S-transferase N-terminal domain-containing protein [Solirubrobacterales bacterium]